MTPEGAIDLEVTGEESLEEDEQTSEQETQEDEEGDGS